MPEEEKTSRNVEMTEQRFPQEVIPGLCVSLRAPRPVKAGWALNNQIIMTLFCVCVGVERMVGFMSDTLIHP